MASPQVIKSCLRTAHRYHRLSIFCVCGLSVVMFHAIGLYAWWQRSVPVFRWAQVASPRVVVQLLPQSSTSNVQGGKRKESSVATVPPPRSLPKTVMNARSPQLQAREKIAIQAKENHDATPPPLPEGGEQRRDHAPHWRADIERMDTHRLDKYVHKKGPADRPGQGAHAPETEVEKLGRVLSNTHNARCRDAYAAAGLLAIVPLVLNTVTQSDNCRW